MDTDVEVVKPLEPFLHHQAFSGFEDSTYIPTGIMACEKDFPLFEELMHYYDTALFLNTDGTMDLTPNVQIITKICLKYGLKCNGEYQVVQGLALYPKDYFCPVTCGPGHLEKTENTVTIHWFAGSWFTEEQKKRHKKLKRDKRKADRKHNIKHLPNRVLRAVLGIERYENLKKRLKK